MGDKLAEEPRAEEEETLDPAGLAMLRWLKLLVTGLAVVMALGIVVIAAVIWMRLGPAATEMPPLPAGLTLPEGHKARAVTYLDEQIIILTDEAEILVYDSAGVLRQHARLENAAD